MAIVLFNPFGELRGSVGANTFTKSASGKEVMRKRTIPVNPQTNAQIEARSNLGIASTAFVLLTDQQRAVWQSYAYAMGVKQARWIFVQRYKHCLTSNSVLANTYSGITPATQPDYDPGSLLSAPSSLVADLNVTDGTVTDGTVLISGLAFVASTRLMSFDIGVAAAAGTWQNFQNAANRDIGVYVELTVRKGQSTYTQSFLSFSEIKLAVAAAVAHITAAKSAFSSADYKYNIAAGDTVTARFYLVDAEACFARIYHSTLTCTAS